ncbi:MAG: molybdopterin-dependent oxidoreductase, partial [Halofilum sp. (in: g-proteobacteria)]
FGTEIAGVRELGATGRGEDMRIGTYVGRMVTSEMSGNVVDLCPVGALTNKPARYTVRPWELIQQPTVSPHDAIGSNLFLHQRRGRIMRAVPRENESINETWISDRDRYSCHGLYSSDRVLTPLIKRNGIWEEVDWDAALPAAVEALKDVIAHGGAEQLAALVSPYATLEEQYLTQKLIRGLGSPHVEHRLRQVDFSDQNEAPVMPWLGQSIAQLEAVDAALLIGSNVRKEQPIAAHRLRKAALGGARISFINARQFDFHFDVDRDCTVHPDRMVETLAGVGIAVAEKTGASVPEAVRVAAGDASPSEDQRAIAEALVSGEAATVLLGSQALSHPALAELRLLADTVARMAEARFGYLPEAGNAAGAWLAGAVPHRGPAGSAVERAGATANELYEQPRRGYLLVGLEPEFDSADGAAATAAMHAAESVVAVAPFTSDAMLQYASVILPGSTFAETAGTFVNAEGLWQDFAAAGSLPGDARPTWKILRVLANELDVSGFDYLGADEIRAELKERCREITLDNRVASDRAPRPTGVREGLVRFGEVPMYSTEPLVRRSEPLQQAADAGRPVARLAPADARAVGVEDGARVVVQQEKRSQTLEVLVDEGVPAGCVWIPQGLPETAELGAAVGPVELKRA